MNGAQVFDVNVADLEGPELAELEDWRTESRSESESPAPASFPSFPDTPAAPAWDRKSLKPWHRELLERMVLRPMDSLKDHAKALGVHEVTIGQVARSDLFMAKLEELMGYKEKLLVLQIDTKMDQAIDQGLNRVYENLSDAECDPRFALDAVVQLDKRRRGDSKGGGAPSVAITIGANDLAEARRMIQVHARSETSSGNSDELLDVLEG